MGVLSNGLNGPYPIPYVPSKRQTGDQKVPLQISANRPEVDENVNRAHWLVVK